jgi:hypothetical protein
MWLKKFLSVEINDSLTAGVWVDSGCADGKRR